MASQTINLASSGIGSLTNIGTAASTGSYYQTPSVSKGGGTYQIYIPIDIATAIGVAASNVTKITFKYEICQERYGVLSSAGTVATGYKNSSGSFTQVKNHNNGIGKGTSAYEPYSDEITSPYYSGNTITLAMKITNVINAQTCYYRIRKVSFVIEYNEPHTHSYKSAVTKQPTCTSAGETTYTCDCGDSFTAALPGSLQHSFGAITAAKEATCLAAGNRAYKKCSRCNLYFAADAGTLSTDGKSDTSSFVIAKKSHSYTGEAKSNGNGKDATHSFKCINGCNNYGGTVKHTWDNGKVTTAPTCIHTGIKTYTCTANGCGATYTEELPIDPNNHYGNDLFAGPSRKPTCTTDGYTGDTYCVACNQIKYPGEVIPALGHIWVDTIYTWSDDGKTCTAKRVCERSGCEGETADAKITSAVKTEATCTEKGETRYTATFGVSWAETQTIDIRDIAAKEHNYASQVIAPTAAVDGYTLHTCQNGCGSSYKDNYTINKIFYGTKQPSKIFFGTQEVKEVYFGTTKVFGPK